MKIVFIPGLGYDKRIFYKLDLAAYDPVFMHWIEPKPNEPFSDYAVRMAEQIHSQPKEKIILIGHSLGGMIAQEIASQQKISKIILLASLKDKSELPPMFKWVRKLKLYPLFIKYLTVNTVFLWGAKHGFRQKADRDLFKSMIAKVSNTYLQWALESFVNWEGNKLNITCPLIRIHGTQDNTILYSYIAKPDYSIEGGDHILMFSQSDKINILLKKELTS